MNFYTFCIYIYNECYKCWFFPCINNYEVYCNQGFISSLFVFILVFVFGSSCYISSSKAMFVYVHLVLTRTEPNYIRYCRIIILNLIEFLSYRSLGVSSLIATAEVMLYIQYVCVRCS